MTERQLHLFNLMYLVVMVVLAVLTRATARRILGALAGGAALGLVGLGLIVLGEWAGVWHMVIDRRPWPMALLAVDFTLTGGLFLVTWRIARRFGGRGLGVALAVAAIVGPPRDYWYMAHFPEWGSYAPGFAPVLAVSAVYIILGVAGHAVMRMVAGPARSDRLAHRPWDAA